MIRKWVSINLLILTFLCHSCRTLLWPAESNIGLTYSVSVPVSEFYPERRILTDWCFAISYTYPSKLSSFYNIPIWPGFANYQAKRELPRLNHTDERFYAKYGYDVSSGLHPKDFSAGQLYGFLEDTLMDYGFHETCLLRSVCELARHPFDDTHRHMFSDIITLILSPSQHEGFLATEQVYQKVYEQAESDGFLGKDCQQLYSMCRHDILALISKVLFY